MQLGHLGDRPRITSYGLGAGGGNTRASTHGLKSIPAMTSITKGFVS